MAKVIVAKTAQGGELGLPLSLANRHGLIAGATGTGKTITLQVLAEQFSAAGVPVFLADVKGDLSGLGAPGSMSSKMQERLERLKLEQPQWRAFPLMLWDVFGQQGHPAHTALSEMGPQLLARLMNLNDTQSSVLQILFKIADESGLLLIDLKDLGALVQFVTNNLDKFKAQYGHLSAASLGTIQRSLLNLESQGATSLFLEPTLDTADLLQTDSSGLGYVHILSSDKLLQTPAVYSCFLLWLLSELFENLPEVGDLEKPKLVFFFDEAHLLFKDTPKVLVEKIEQIVRLIRSKGVGVYFVTQNPLDIPETVLGQLSHRVQHALRAFTPSDQKAVKSVAQTMRPNPSFSAAEAVTQLGVGEALVSFLDERGTPTVVERAFVLPPASKIGPVDEAVRRKIIESSPVFGHYEKTIDRESAYEMLKESNEAKISATPIPASAPDSGGSGLQDSLLKEVLFGSVGPRGGRKAGLVEKAATSAARSVATSVGRELVRGIMGSLLGGSSRRRR
jgi:uncharacterized protein